MTSSGGPTDDLPTGGTASSRPGAADQEALRRFVDELRRSITQAFDDWDDAGSRVLEGGARRDTRTFARPVTAPPVRMEQMARTPEPTADLDDLVDLLVPRLVEQLVPALRAALRDDDQPTQGRRSPA